MKYYDGKVLINLINQHGSEGSLEKVFAETFKLMNEPSLK